MKQKKAIIIGAGYSGLAAASLLAKQGLSVTLLEKNEGPGGRAQAYEENGFLFDMGPSWYLMPEAFERLFRLLGTTPVEQYPLVRLDPSYRIFHGGDPFDVQSELEANRALFDSFEPGGFQKTIRYLDRAERQYRISMDQFLYRDYARIGDLLSFRLLRQGWNLGLTRTVSGLTGRAFSSDLLRKIMGYTMVFIGGSPDKTPGFYSLMSHIDLRLHVWYPMGGMSMPARALETIGRNLGAEYRYRNQVRRICTRNGRIEGVETDDGFFAADIVIANADYHHTETSLLSPGERGYSESYWRRRTISPSAFIIFMGIGKKLPMLQHHNLYFHVNWDEHFDTIFDRRRWPDRFSYYVCCPSRTDPAVAPPDGENLFFLVPVAPGLADDDPVREEFAARLLDHFERLIGTTVRDAVITSRIFSQRDFISAYHSLEGSAFGLSHTLLQTAIFRPAQRSRRVGNLYFTGQYTHPGVGVPMTLIAAEVLAGIITKEHGI